VNPKILILGSLPGDRSLEENQYYAHPQNRFWQIIKNILEVNAEIEYIECVSLLEKSGICLWDVCMSAQRTGSMDSNIEKETPNEINKFVTLNPSITTIVFNGQKAQKLYDKHLIRIKDLKYITLPSTSPANAKYK